MLHKYQLNKNINQFDKLILHEKHKHETRDRQRELKPSHHGSSWPAEYPWAWWLHAWHGWRTGWCPQKDPQDTPPLPPEGQALHGSGTADQSAIILQGNKKSIINQYLNEAVEIRKYVYPWYPGLLRNSLQEQYLIINSRWCSYHSKISPWSPVQFPWQASGKATSLWAAQCSSDTYESHWGKQTTNYASEKKKRGKTRANIQIKPKTSNLKPLIALTEEQQFQGGSGEASSLHQL